MGGRIIWKMRVSYHSPTWISFGPGPSAGRCKNSVSVDRGGDQGHECEDPCSANALSCATNMLQQCSRMFTPLRQCGVRDQKMQKKKAEEWRSMHYEPILHYGGDRLKTLA